MLVGTGRPSARSSARLGMSTPAAIVSGIAPGNRGFTSSRAGTPSRSRRSCTFATPSSRMARATSAAVDSSSASCTVRPAIETPESTRVAGPRHRRDDADAGRRARPPSTRRPAGTPARSGRRTCRRRWRRSRARPRRASSASSSARLRTMRTPRDPAPRRGFAITGKSQSSAAALEVLAAESEPGYGRPRRAVAGTRAVPRTAVASASLSSAVSRVRRLGAARVAPSSSRRRARGGSSTSTVENTTSISSSATRVAMPSTKAGSLPGSTIRRWSGGTR